jgi:UDP-N-acetyl-2-amino-2-deoxyglucuronate dehydrogenase
MKTWSFIERMDGDERTMEENRVQPPNVYGFGHVEYLNKVVESIRDSRSALVDGLEGRKSLELISAIYESVERGQEVFLRFVPQKCRLGQVSELQL